MSFMTENRYGCEFRYKHRDSSGFTRLYCRVTGEECKERPSSCKLRKQRKALLTSKSLSSFFNEKSL